VFERVFEHLGMTAAVPAPVERARAGAGTADDRPLPVLPALEPLFAAGGLRRGSAVAVRGSASLLLALLAGPSRDGAWCAVVGLPSLGLVAAGEAGVALDRLALVPDPGRDWAAVAAALLDAVDVVVVAPRGRVLDGDVRRLAARARQRRAVLVPYGAVAWPGVDLRLSVASGEWEGLSEGSGHLRARRAVVRGEGRGAAARARELRLWLPAPGGGVEADTTPVTPLRAIPTGTGRRIPAAAAPVPPPLRAVPDLVPDVPAGPPAAARRPDPRPTAPERRPVPPPMPPRAVPAATRGPRPTAGPGGPGPLRAMPAGAAERQRGPAGPGRVASRTGPQRPPLRAVPDEPRPPEAPLLGAGAARRPPVSPPGRIRPLPSAPDPGGTGRGRGRPAYDGRRRTADPPERPAAPATRPRPAGHPVPAGRFAAAGGDGHPVPPPPTAARPARPRIPAEVLARLRPASSLPRPPRPAADGRR